MSHTEPELTPEDFRKPLLDLSPQDRHQSLKALDANALFCAVMPLLPARLRDEFHWLEKRDYIRSILKRPLAEREFNVLLERESKNRWNCWPTCLQSLADQRLPDDELWLFEDIPGDKGYALVRHGHVIDFSITEITTATTS